MNVWVYPFSSRKSFGDGKSSIITVRNLSNIKVKFLLNYSAALTLITLLFVSLGIKQYGEIVGFFSLSI